MGVIGRSVSDPSQILQNSKKRFANSLILDKNKKIEKIAQIGNCCQLKSNLLLVFIYSVLFVLSVFRKKQPQIFGIVEISITSASDIIPLICAICVQKKRKLCPFASLRSGKH
jgi:hypothetical protein